MNCEYLKIPANCSNSSVANKVTAALTSVSKAVDVCVVTKVLYLKYI